MINPLTPDSNPKDPVAEFTYPVPVHEALGEVLASVRRKVLSEFLQELMLLLESEKYQIHEVLAALGDFAESQQRDEEAQVLDEASEALLNIRRKSYTTEKS
jgi:hypothetical protein